MAVASMVTALSRVKAVPNCDVKSAMVFVVVVAPVKTAGSKVMVLPVGTAARMSRRVPGPESRLLVTTAFTGPLSASVAPMSATPTGWVMRPMLSIRCSAFSPPVREPKVMVSPGCTV